MLSTGLRAFSVLHVLLPCQGSDALRLQGVLAGLAAIAAVVGFLAKKRVRLVLLYPDTIVLLFMPLGWIAVDTHPCQVCLAPAYYCHKLQMAMAEALLSAETIMGPPPTFPGHHTPTRGVQAQGQLWRPCWRGNGAE